MTTYRHIITRIFAEYLEFIPKEKDIETLAVLDDESGNYVLLDLGWEPTRRIHAVIIHLRIRDDRVWIEQDHTENGIARDLLKAGVLPQDIVLGFQPPDMRPYAQELLTVP